jgi:hypothetical protein
VLETPHVVVGAAIAAKVVNPTLAIPLSLMSHFVLDKIPHWNPHLFTETEKLGHPSKKSTIFALADVGLALFLGLLVASKFWGEPTRVATVLACCLASVFPDLIKWPYYYLKARWQPLVNWVLFERKIQVNAPLYPGILTQLLVVITGLWWISN